MWKRIRLRRRWAPRTIGPPCASIRRELGLTPREIVMLVKLNRAFTIAASLALAIVVAPSFSNSEFVPVKHAHATYSRIRIADAHSDVCLANEQQCLQGCDGATSCSNQCEANYQGCLSQGQ